MEFHSSIKNCFNCVTEEGFLLLTLGLIIAHKSSMGYAKSGILGGFCIHPSLPNN
jgi:hypothetical protein